MEEPTSQSEGPRVVLGLLTFGPPGSEFHGSRVTSLDDFNACLDHFQSRGYNEVDTARQYVKGQQEGFTNLARWQDRGLSLATKCYPEQPGWHSKSKIREILETSLAELGTKQVHTFYLHAPDRSVPFKETMEACDELYREGKFVRLGLSNYAAWEVAEIWNIANENGYVKPKVYQAMYNALTRDIETELIPCCRKYGISIYVYNPLAGGALTGRYKTFQVPDEGRFAQTDPRIGGMYRDRYFKDNTFKALRLIEPAAANYQLSLLDVAFRWCAHHSLLDIKKGDGVVVGVSSLAQLEANLNYLEKGPLPSDVVEVLEQAWELSKPTCPPYWR